MNSELTLEKAISKARQKEVVKQQQVVPAVMEAVRGRRPVVQTKQRKTASVHKAKEFVVGWQINIKRFMPEMRTDTVAW